VGEVHQRFSEFVDAEVERLIGQLAVSGNAELRRSFAGPLAAGSVAFALGLPRGEVGRLLSWYDQIVAGVSAITAGSETPAAAEEAFDGLRARLQEVIDGEDRSSLLASTATSAELSVPEIVSNAAVLLFGGIETTEGMIANALLGLLGHPGQLASVREQPKLLDRAVEESLRLEPAAAVVDRYATEDAELAGTAIAAGDLIRVSITGANRDPAIFPEPDRFDLERANSRRHLAFAQGPHVCLGVHLARLEARTALSGLLARFPRLRLDPERPAEVRGLVFRKPVELWARWD
jgi:cytochrome P450